MTATDLETSASTGASTTRAPDVGRKGNIVVQYLTTTDHKRIGYLYLTTSFVYFLIGGVMALVIRAQLAAPGLHLVP
ncbi:MAG TPA: cytochrome ubiquinol oxidase subunit I, partial [Amnibacterium sp.]|nr:cytochrome ubiquinol oxidase subunit I [Amnibacterium sp.]